MTSSTILEMGGIACAITADDRRLIELLGQRYEGFLSANQPQFSIDVDVLPSAGHDQSPLEIEGSPVDVRLHGHTLEFTGRAFSAQFDLSARRGRIRQPLNLTPLDLMVKAIYAYYLLQEEACFVHACALVRAGQGYLFFGPTGSGKSTLARSADGGVLADEFVIVKRQPDGHGSSYALHGTPYWGGMNVAAPLNGLFHLRIGDCTAVTSTAPTRLLRMLLPCLGSFVPSADHQARLFEMAASLVRQVAGYELCVADQSNVWSCLDAVTG